MEGNALSIFYSSVHIYQISEIENQRRSQKHVQKNLPLHVHVQTDICPLTKDC